MENSAQMEELFESQSQELKTKDTRIGIDKIISEAFEELDRQEGKREYTGM